MEETIRVKDIRYNNLRDLKIKENGDRLAL